MSFKKNILQFFILLNLTFAFSQNQRQITGIVLDSATKQPLAGASILIKNTAMGAISGTDGRFSYLIKDKDFANSILTISYLGYTTKSIKVGLTTDFKILLDEDPAVLDDVIVTSSYGTKKRKEEAVGAITSLKGSDLQVKQSVESFDKLLDGAVAGLLISSSSVQGAPVKIEIRGQGTLTPLNAAITGTSRQPLIIIDGVIMAEEKGFDNQLFDGTGSLTEQFKNPLAKISPEDIEDITILKDASAVGIYGSDAANGVILVTTKKAKNKKLSFTFATQTGFSKPINKIKYLSGSEYFDIKREYLLSQGQTISQATANAGSSTIDTNWFDLLNRQGAFNRYNFNVGTAYKNWNFRASFNALLNEEPQISNNFNRLGGNINVGYSSKKINIQLAVSPSKVTQNEPNTLFNFPLPPNISPFNADGSFAQTGSRGFGNALAVAAQNLKSTKTNGAVASINASYNVTKNIKITALFGVDYGDKTQNLYFSGDNESGVFNGTIPYTFPNGTTTNLPILGRRLDNLRKSFRWNQSTSVSFEKKWKTHSFDGILGLELQHEDIVLSRTLAAGFLNAGPVNEASNSIGKINYNSYVTEEARRSVFSQFNYNYKKKYFALVNVRRDESSVFGADVNATYNGGLGLAWNISNEDFLKKNKTIDFFRLRISYGLTGNSRIGSYRALGLYNVSTDSYSGYNGGINASPSSAPNPNLTWEKNYKFNAGVDFNFIDKYKITTDFFIDTKKDIISNSSIPPETGYSGIDINGSGLTNKGIEFSISSNWISKPNFSWTTRFNISQIKNEVTQLVGLASTYSASERARAQKVGISTSAIWGVKFAGIDPATGRELFYNKGQIYDSATYQTLFGSNDWEVIGDSNPDFFGGIQNTFTFLKNFSLTIRANFKYGSQVLIQDELESQYRVLVNRNLSINVLDRWRQQGDISNNPRVTDNNPIIPNSSKFLYDDSNIKIQNINFSYQFPNDLFKAKWLKNTSVFCDLTNVIYFYKQKSPTGRNGIREYANLYPEAQTLTFGFQTNF